MNVSDTFSSYCRSIHLASTDSYDVTFSEICKTLERHYYEDDADNSHLLYVGSVGRGTAVDGTSDVDLLFVLPRDVKSRFDAYEGNKQSCLLQEVKDVLAKRYTQTTLKGDGQAVVIDFSSKHYTIDLVPAFECSDGSYDYPDSNDGGHWKRTNPLPEQRACKTNDKQTGSNYSYCCNILRAWKDEQGFPFSGLLIDTLVDKFQKEDDDACHASFADYPAMLGQLFKMLSSEDATQSYWYALGSNQEISDKGHGKFVRKASKAYELLSAVESDDDFESAFVELLGNVFSSCVVGSSRDKRLSSLAEKYDVRMTEQFITSMYFIDIKYNLKIDCTVTQDGFRTAYLCDMLKRHVPLLCRKDLDFRIVENDVPRPYEVYWKVRNCGDEAYRRDCIRGQIVKDAGKGHRHECTNFRGPHYVECYVIKSGICVARDRIRVPIAEQ